MTTPSTELTGGVAFSCCALLAAYFILSAVAVTVAIVDIVGGRTHLALDIFLLLVFALPTVTGAFRRVA